MLTKRIIPCLDVKDGRVVKGVNFVSLRDAGDPVECAKQYNLSGADELVFLDITATLEARDTVIDMVERVANEVFIPFTVGGGIRTVDDIRAILNAGADKVSLNSAAVKDPSFVKKASEMFGAQCIVLGMDPVETADRSRCPSGYEITTRGFRNRTGMDAVEWAKRAEGLGAGEIVVNSVDADGTRAGFELTLTRLIAEAVSIPVVASGGAGHSDHLRDAFLVAHADAAIVAGMIHTREWTIPQIKADLRAAGIPVRMTW